MTLLTALIASCFFLGLQEASEELRVPAPPRAMGPNLTAGPSGVFLTWLEPGKEKTDKSQATILLRVSHLGPKGWEKARTVVEGTKMFANWADFPSLIETSSKGLLSHWLRMGKGDGYSYDIALALAETGKGFQSKGLLHDAKDGGEHGFVSFVREGKKVRAFWLDGRHMDKKGGTMLLLSRTIDEKGNLSKEEVLDDDACTCCQTSATLTNTGPLVVYRDHNKAEIRDIAVVRWTGKAWSQPRLVHKDGWNMPACPVNGPSVDAQGSRVAIAWFTAAKDKAQVKVAFSQDGGKSFDSPILVDGESPIGRVTIVHAGKGALLAWFAQDKKEAVLRLARIEENGKIVQQRDIARLPRSRATGFPRMIRIGSSAILVWRNIGADSGLRSIRLKL